MRSLLLPEACELRVSGRTVCSTYKGNAFTRFYEFFLDQMYEVQRLMVHFCKHCSRSDSAVLDACTALRSTSKDPTQASAFCCIDCKA